MTFFSKRFSVLMCLGLLMLPASLWAGELRLSVAGSMIDVVKEVGAAFVKEQPQIKLLPNFASSGSLAKQLAAGAPADLFISANPKWMDFVVAQGIVPGAGVSTLAYNRLVVVGHSGLFINAMSDLQGLKRIALGSPKSVPAGRYAQQALEKAGLYQQLLENGKLVMTKDVRQALLYADRGEVDAAFVYATDVPLAKEARVLLEVPQEFYPRVSYPMGMTVSGADKEEARAFLEFLQGAVARGIFERHGFVVEE